MSASRKAGASRSSRTAQTGTPARPSLTRPTSGRSIAVTGRLPLRRPADLADLVVTIKVTDNGTPSLSASRTFTIHVVDLAPVVNLGGDASLTLPSPLAKIGGFVDPDADTWTATVDYGDGSGAVGSCPERRQDVRAGSCLCRSRDVSAARDGPGPTRRRRLGPRRSWFNRRLRFRGSLAWSRTSSWSTRPRAQPCLTVVRSAGSAGGVTIPFSTARRIGRRRRELSGRRRHPRVAPAR